MGDMAQGASLLATGFNLLGQSQKASATATADAYRANQADLAAKYGQVQATQTDNFYRQRAQSAVANIAAVRAAGGSAADSPTSSALAARTLGVYDQERDQRVANINAQVASDQGAAAFYQQSAQSALSAGTVGMLGTLAGGLGGAFQSMGIGGKSAGGGLDVGFQGWMPTFS